MSRAKTKSRKNFSSTHNVLIGAPLLAVVVFCFSFVLLQPDKTAPMRSTASQTTHTEPTAQTPSSAALAEIPLAQETNLPTLDEANPTEGNAVSSINTGTPQASAKANSPKSANPQGASGQQIGPNTVIHVSNNSLLKNLTNLLR